MKLLLQGATETEGEPQPVILPGEDKPVSSAKIKEYLNEEFWYYYGIYTDCKHCGNPFNAGWSEWPAWLRQLIAYFDGTVDAVRAHNQREAYKGIKHGRTIT